MLLTSRVAIIMMVQARSKTENPIKSFRIIVILGGSSVGRSLKDLFDGGRTAVVLTIEQSMGFLWIIISIKYLYSNLILNFE